MAALCLAQEVYHIWRTAKQSYMAWHATSPHAQGRVLARRPPCVRGLHHPPRQVGSTNHRVAWRRDLPQLILLTTAALPLVVTRPTAVNPQPLTASRLAGHLPAVRRCVDRAMASLASYAANGQPLDAKKLFAKMSLATVGEVAYG